MAQNDHYVGEYTHGSGVDQPIWIAMGIFALFTIFCSLNLVRHIRRMRRERPTRVKVTSLDI